MRTFGLGEVRRGVRRAPRLKGSAMALAATLAAVGGAAPAAAAPGDLDPTFSGDGRQLTDFPGRDHDSGEDVARQADGKVVVAGQSGVTQPALRRGGDFALARYNVDGSLDRRFSEDGRVIISFSDGADGASAVAVQRDGKIVVAGSISRGRPTAGLPSEIGVARLHPDGSLDRSFSGDGRVLVRIGGWASASDMALSGAGNVEIAGSASRRNGSGGIALARLNSDGSLDESFSRDGKQISDFGSDREAGVKR
jgi:uncharacterized delta-60 repeat protein